MIFHVIKFKVNPLANQNRNLFNLTNGSLISIHHHLMVSYKFIIYKPSDIRPQYLRLK